MSRSVEESKGERRLRRRREQNRLSAQRSREKQRELIKSYTQEYQVLASSNTDLRRQIRELHHTKSKLSDLLERHLRQSKGTCPLVQHSSQRVIQLSTSRSSATGSTSAICEPVPCRFAATSCDLVSNHVTTDVTDSDNCVTTSPMFVYQPPVDGPLPDTAVKCSFTDDGFLDSLIGSLS